MEFIREFIARMAHGIRDADTRKAYNEVFDARTVKILLKMKEQGILDSLGRVVSTGKEANVFEGWVGGEKVAVKIYRINTTEFRHLWKYVEGDPRFRVRKRGRRSIIEEWARREFRNLSKAREHGVNVPMPVYQRENVLVMQFVGDEVPAPLLKDAYPFVEEGFVEELLDNLARLYFGAGIVHADLSEYNILVWEGPYLIDMGQSVGWDHPRAWEFFYRDMDNLRKVLMKLGIKTERPDVLLRERYEDRGEGSEGQDRGSDR